MNERIEMALQRFVDSCPSTKNTCKWQFEVERLVKEAYSEGFRQGCIFKGDEYLRLLEEQQGDEK
jgi:hypothetical protein